PEPSPDRNAPPMLSRTADSLYWLSRYVERAENTARIIDAASRSAALPASYTSANEWEGALAATSSLTAFHEHYDAVTPDNV
ncbi:alpha-E domain-containing protein, partial [Mycobacterium tuberculosis]|nr:alpha-E domain-containing protein [Mycobacterium tuberculosis]